MLKLWHNGLDRCAGISRRPSRWLELRKGLQLFRCRCQGHVRWVPEHLGLGPSLFGSMARPHTLLQLPKESSRNYLTCLPPNTHKSRPLDARRGRFSLDGATTARKRRHDKGGDSGECPGRLEGLTPTSIYPGHALETRAMYIAVVIFPRISPATSQPLANSEAY